MGQFVATKENITGAQAANQVSTFPDTDLRIKTLDEFGVRNILTPMGWRDNNIILNGEFDYAQRQVPATLTTYSNTTGRTYAADRWGMTNENTSIQYQRVDSISAIETGLASRFYGKFKKITSTGKFILTQVVESGNMAHLRGRTVRVQAKMKYSIASSMTVRLGLIQLQNAGTVDTMPATYVSAFGAVGTDPTLGANLAYIAPNTAPSGDGGTINGNAMDCVLTSAWVRYSATFNIPTNCKNLVMSIWTNGQPIANDELNITECGIYEGQEIRDWFPRNQAEQLAQVQRYYCKTFPIDTAPVQNGGLLGTLKFILGKAAATALSAQMHWRFPVNMRVAPATNTTYNPSVANAQVRQTSGTVADLSATVVANASETGIDITATGASGGTIGDQVGVHISCDAEI